MSTPTRDVTKLPQWAQNRIKQLEGNVRYHKERADRADAGDTTVWIQRHGAGVANADIPLIPDSTICFYLDGEERQIQFYQAEEDGEQVIEVYGVSRQFSEGLSIYPRADNRVVIKMRRVRT